MRRPFRSARLRAAAAALVLLAGAATLALSLRGGLRTIRAFRRRDTRADVHNWVYSVFPEGAGLGVDDYVGQCARGVPCEPVYLPRLPEFWPGVRRGRELPEGSPTVGWYLRNASFPGRLGNRRPFSRRLLPEAASNVVAFARDARLLRAWRPAPGRARPTFAQPDVELWALSVPAASAGPFPWPAAAPGGSDLALSFSRPVRFVDGGLPFFVPEGVPGPLGPDRAQRLVGKRRWIRASPGVATNGAFAVFFHAAGPAPVRVSAESLGGRRLEWTLAPGEAVAAPLPADRFARAAHADPFPGFRARMRGDSEASLVLAFVAPDAAEASRLLRRASPSAARAFWDGRPRAGAAERLEARLAGAVPLSEEEAAETERDVRLARAGAEGGAPALRGAPWASVAAFSRLRLPPGSLDPGRLFPVWLPPGRYAARLAPDPADDPAVFRTNAFLSVQTAPWRETRDAAGRTVFETEFDVPAPGIRPVVPEEFPVEVLPRVPRALFLEFRWDPRSALAAALDAL